MEDKYLSVELKLNENKAYSNPVVLDFPITKPSLNELNSQEVIHIMKKKKTDDDIMVIGEKNNIIYEGKSKTSKPNCK